MMCCGVSTLLTVLYIVSVNPHISMKYYEHHLHFTETEAQR